MSSRDGTYPWLWYEERTARYHSLTGRSKKTWTFARTENAASLWRLEKLV